MPPKRNKRYTQNSSTGKKQNNTTLKNTARVSKRKSLEEALSEKLTDDLVQKLFDNPGTKYSILIDFCGDNNFVVNTAKLLDDSFIPPEEGYEVYKNQLTIPDDFEKGKLLDIIIKVDEDVIQYATIVNQKNKYYEKNCGDTNLPVIYHIPEITPVKDKDLLSSTPLDTSVTDEQQTDEGDLDQVPRRPMSYDEEITSPDDVVEQAQINMNDLVVKDLEDVTEIDSNISVTASSGDLSKELKAKVKEDELKGVTEKPKLKVKDYNDDFNLLKKKTEDKSPLRSREEGDRNTTRRIDFKELAKKKKNEKEIDELAHARRLRAEKEENNKKNESQKRGTFVQKILTKEAEEHKKAFMSQKKEEEEMLFEPVSDDEAEKEEKREKLFQKYADEIDIISNILQSIMRSGNISSNKTHRDDYTPALGQLKTKYEALIDIFNKDDTTHIPKETKETVINVLTNNHRRLQALRTSDRGRFGTGLKFESNFMEKVKDSLSIMNTLKTYFETLDESLMKNFGNKPQVSYDYTKYVGGGKKTRKNRRKTKQRKTKKRT
jgi:hypothetical protein